MQQFIAAGALVAFILALQSLYGKARPVSRLPLPPGPKKLPIIGNLLDMPVNMEWKTYHQWCKEFNSDIIHINISGTSVVVLDTLEAANDLLDKRSSNYSSRPRMPMLLDLMDYNYLIATMEYGERWRQRRRLVQQALSPISSHNFLPPLLKASRNLLNRFLDIPDDIMGNLRHMTGESIMSVAYGIDVQPSKDPYIELSEKGIQGPSAAVIPGAFLVDMFPFLTYVPEWVPGAGFQRKAREWKKLGRDMVEIPFESTKQNMRDGISRPCFTSIALQELENGIQDVAYTEENIKNSAATLYTVGGDTTLSILGSCVLGLMDHPEVVKKAQAELDRVLMPGHLPDFDDEPSLPYITAIAKEALRWNDVTPLGVPHVVNTEDEYKEYRIPAGSLVIANSWAILHDEVVYPDPFTFNPERFMKGEQLDPNVQDPADACFGFGRRICPGRHMAFSSVWIFVASLLSVCDVKKKIDEDGNVVEPGNKFLSTIIHTPKPFIGSITPRSKDSELLIRAVANQDAI